MLSLFLYVSEVLNRNKTDDITQQPVLLFSSIEQLLDSLANNIR